MAQLKIMFGEIDQLHEAEEHSEAYKKLKEANKESNPEVLWRLARACHQMAMLLDSEDPKKKELLNEAHGYATSAYELRGNDFNVIKWMAAVTGSRTDFLGIREKVQQGNLFKSLLDKALAINHEDTMLMYMRGRFAYSVASLSWFERKVAALFGSSFEATYDDAIADFLLVTQQKPEWLENSLFLAKAYLAKGDKKNALIHIEKAVGPANSDGGDENEEEEAYCVKEAMELLKKLRK